ncbi:ribosome assembly RNA-binding protein YhbY [Methylomonas sp. CM2]|uniref:ribosome assembly RNA-binding protein YhbY n=1 Tax=Methylomonas sp. CM2 TaxID=3417647 RepID=UPI003CFA873A
MRKYHRRKQSESDPKKQLKAQAHALNPVVMVGQAGLTPAVVKEVDQALLAHELIKVKIRAERHDRAAISEQICGETGAELVQSIGQIAVLFRPNPKK